MLGLIALTYGVALLFQVNGFLAVFTAGLAVRAIEQSPPAHIAPAAADEPVASVEPKQSVRALTSRLLVFTEQLERLAEVVVVLLFVALMLLVVRKLAVSLVLIGTALQNSQQRLLGWFGIRGVGSLYYLSFGLTHDLDAGPATHAVKRAKQPDTGLVRIALMAALDQLRIHRRQSRANQLQLELRARIWL